MEILDWLKNQNNAECQIAYDEIAYLRQQLAQQPSVDVLVDAERMKFLHSDNKDQHDCEWGVARVHFSKDGIVESFYWGLSDNSDLDKAMNEAKEVYK